MELLEQNRRPTHRRHAREGGNDIVVGIGIDYASGVQEYWVPDIRAGRGQCYDVPPARPNSGMTGVGWGQGRGHYDCHPGKSPGDTSPDRDGVSR